MAKEIEALNLFKGLYKNKRVLVTGNTGFKGGWLCLWLQAMGAQVAGTSRGIPSEPNLYHALNLRNTLTHFEVDVTDFPSLQKVFETFRPEIVFHLAAQPIVRKSYDDPKLTFDSNLGGTVNVLECLRLSKEAVAAVFITTDKVYENKEQQRGYVETDQLGGSDPYSASKACAELAVSAYNRSFFLKDGTLGCSTARAGNVIGGGDWAADRIVPDCIKAWLKKEKVVLRKPEAVRPWQHVLEPLSGYLWLGALLASGEKKIFGEAFNFGPKEEGMKSVGELTDQLFKFLNGSGWEYVPHEGQKKEMNFLTLNCQKAEDVLSWRPVLNFEETLRLTAQWYKDYYEKKDMVKVSLEQIESFCAKAAQEEVHWSAKSISV